MTKRTLGSIAIAAMTMVFGAGTAFAATSPAVASAVSSCCDAVCCALGLPCC